MLSKKIKLYKQHNKEERCLIVKCIALKLALIHYCRVEEYVLNEILEKTNPVIIIENFETVIIKKIHSEPLLEMIEARKEKLFSPMPSEAAALI